MIIPKIYLIGSGNVAWHLAHALIKHSLPLKGIWSRNNLTALELSNSVNVPLLSKNDLPKLQGVFFLCVSDKAIPEIADFLSSKILIHCAGSVPLSVLTAYTNNCGVFYPLQTFSKYRNLTFSDIPILIESSNKEIEKLLISLCHNLSCKNYFYTSEQRLKIHIAAVFANNFSNFMFTLAHYYLIYNHIDTDILKPLIKETFDKINSRLPIECQTGPAIRNDILTIEKHLSALKDTPDLKKFYSFVTESIYLFYRNNEKNTKF